MNPRPGKIGLLAAALACALIGPAPASARNLRREPRAEEPKAEGNAVYGDIVGPALEKRIRGQAGLDDVRIDVGWTTGNSYGSARIYGNGIVICDGKLQFAVTKAEVVAVLKNLQTAHFGAMPPYYGESEEDERNEPPPKGNEGPRLKGRIVLRAGSIQKTVLQLVDGEQSEELEALANKILEICRGAAKKGVAATSLADGLEKLGSRALAPETLRVMLQRRADGPDKAGETNWILDLEGRRVTDQMMPAGQKPPQPRLLVLSEADFQSLVRLLAGARPSEIPINLYEPRYTDLRIEVLNRSRAISGRRFVNMTAETHGEKQKAFDRIYEALRALHERVEKDGKPILVTTASGASHKDREEAEEREKQEKKEKEKEKD